MQLLQNIAQSNNSHKEDKRLNSEIMVLAINFFTFCLRVIKLYASKVKNYVVLGNLLIFFFRNQKDVGIDGEMKLLANKVHRNGSITG